MSKTKFNFEVYLGCVNKELQNMLSCRMRITLLAVIVYYSVSFQRIAATVLFSNELTGDRIVTFDNNGFADAIDWRFPFLGQIRNSLTISKDGYILFDRDDSADPEVNVNVLRRTNIDGFQSGYVWRRLTNDTTTLSQVNRDIQPYFSVVGSYTFYAKWALLVTWYEVTATPPSSTNKNTFQLILATDGIVSFAMRNYENIATDIGNIRYGFNSPGTMLSIYSGIIPSSHTVLKTRSNVGIAGRWLLRVDGKGILEPDCVGFSISTETTGSRINMQSPFRVENVPGATDCSSGTTALTSRTFATSFMMVPCNAGVSGLLCVSISPIFAPDKFVRHSDDEIYLCGSGISGDNSFNLDSSFIIVPNTFKNGFFALQSYNNPDFYIQFQANAVTQTERELTADYNNSASFTLGILPNCPYGDKATWCSTIETNLCFQPPFDVLCRATCDARTTTTATTTTTTTTTTTAMGPLKLTKCARPAYRIANSEFCKNWFPFNRRPFRARWSNWAGRGAGRRFW